MLMHIYVLSRADYTSKLMFAVDIPVAIQNKSNVLLKNFLTNALAAAYTKAIHKGF